MKFIQKIFTYPILFLVKIYQWLISPIFPANCRFNPTCSHYMIDALNEWGPIKGTYLGLKRIGKCHPWGGFGDDPVPRRRDIKKK